MTDIFSAPAFEQWDGDFDGQTFGMKITNQEGAELMVSMTVEQVAELVGNVFRLVYDWQQNHAPAGQKPKDIPVDALIPVHGLGLAQGIDAQHATIVVGSGPLSVGFHTETTKVAQVCEALHQAPRTPLNDPRKPKTH